MCVLYYLNLNMRVNMRVNVRVDMRVNMRVNMNVDMRVAFYTMVGITHNRYNARVNQIGFEETLRCIHFTVCFIHDESRNIINTQACVQNINS